MGESTTIAVDLAKSVFEVAVSSHPGRVTERQRLSRAALARFLAQRLQEDVAVPVYDSLARGDHPVFKLLPEVADPGTVPGPEERRALLQAVLVRTLT